MIHVSSECAHRYDRVKRKGAAFFTNLFKSRKLAIGMKINEDEEIERAPRVETPGKISLSAILRKLFIVKKNLREIRNVLEKFVKFLIAYRPLILLI